MPMHDLRHGNLRVLNDSFGGFNVALITIRRPLTKFLNDVVLNAMQSAVSRRSAPHAVTTEFRAVQINSFN